MGGGLRRSALVVATALAAVVPALAESWEVVPFVGVCVGGDVEETSSGASSAFDPSPAWGLTVGRAVSGETRIEGTWSHQPTAIEGSSIDLDVDQLHVAAVYQPDKQNGTRGYVLASAGLSRIESSDPGGSAPVFFSLGVGGGARVPLDRRLSLRLEARAWLVLTSTEAGAICGGGCTFVFAGSGLLQLQATAGLAVAF